MHITEILMREHRVIERIVPVLQEAAVRLESGTELNRDIFPTAIEFLHIFADECHHGLEEAELFPAMGRAGIDTESGLVAGLKKEHQAMRALVRRLDELWNKPGEEKPAREIRAAVRTLDRTMSIHVEKEDQTCFPLADKVLSVAQQAELTEYYEEIQSREPCKGTFDYYQDLISTLEKQLG